MTTKTHFEKLENMYLTVDFNQTLSPKMKISKGKCVLDIIVSSAYFHSASALHGAIIFKTLDDSAFFAAASMETNVFIVTGSFNSHFVRPVLGEVELRSEGNVLEQSKSQIIAESVTYNDMGKRIAFGTGIFKPTKISLDNIEKYSK